MNPQKMTIAILAALSASIALADDFKTINGKEYKNATVSRVEPDGITVKFSGGLVKIPFSELSKELQDKYSYNPERASAAYAEQVAAIQQANQQTEESAKQRTEEQSKQRNVQALRNSLAALQEEENTTLAQIGKIETEVKIAGRRWVSQGGTTSQGQWATGRQGGVATGQQQGWMSGHWGTSSSEGQLPLLRSHLDDVRKEEQRVRREVDFLAAQERAQRQP